VGNDKGKTLQRESPSSHDIAEIAASNRSNKDSHESESPEEIRTDDYVLFLECAMLMAYVCHAATTFSDDVRFRRWRAMTAIFRPIFSAPPR
jgi:hypothetical protein